MGRSVADCSSREAEPRREGAAKRLAGGEAAKRPRSVAEGAAKRPRSAAQATTKHLVQVSETRLQRQGSLLTAPGTVDEVVDGQWRPAALKTVEELVILNEIGAKLASTLELDAILAYVMEKVKQVFGVEACSLMLLDEEKNVLQFKVSTGTGADEVKTLSFPADQGLAGWMVREKKPLLVKDVQADPRFYGRIDRSTGLVTCSLIGTPLLAQERVVGVLEAINKLRGPFREDDLRLLLSIATPVAQAIENARLFRALTKAYADVLVQERRVEESRNTLRAVFDGIGDELIILDRQWRVMAANLAACSAAGLSPDALVGKPLHEALPALAGCFGNNRCPVTRTFEDGEHAQHLCKLQGGNGSRELDIRTYPLFAEDGQVGKVVVFVRDVTEQRQLELSVARAAKLAALGRLAAGAAHELANPLTAILGNAALLQRVSTRDSPAYSMAGTILDAADRSKNILRSLLDYARLDQYTFAPTDVNASLEWALSLLKYCFDDNVIQLEKELAPQLPLVMASESHLRTLWTNLLMNAVDATQAKGKAQEEFTGWVKVASAYLKRERTLQITVQDNGVGISEELMPRLFEPFLTTKRHGEGTGLGLYICHTIVEQHGGRMDVSSHNGSGAQFTVTLPEKGPKTSG